MQVGGNLPAPLLVLADGEDLQGGGGLLQGGEAGYPGLLGGLPEGYPKSLFKLSQHAA